jgi:thiosulfate dehydrogenase (quinone) large subunit
MPGERREETAEMDGQAEPVAAMRFPERWLAVLRIAVGVWFAKAIFTKLSIMLAWGFLPIPTASDRWIHVMPTLVGKYAEGNPVGFFREFLQNNVVTHPQLFAQLTAFGEAAAGLGLVFGCLTTLASAIGLVLVVNYGLAVQWQGSSQQGFHYMLITALVVIIGAHAGRIWGVDGWVRVHRPGSWLARLPLG